MSADAKKLAIALSKNSDTLPVIPYKTNIYNLFNLANRTPTKVTPDMVVADWYNQVAKYDFSTSATENNPTPSDPDFLVKAATSKCFDIIY